MSNRFVLVERFGGLFERNAEPIAAIDQVALEANCIAALCRFAEAGFGLALVIDPGDRQIAGPASADASLQVLSERWLASQGVSFAATLRCAHEPDSDCDCALPGIGLVADLIADPDFDRAESLIVGARAETQGLARALGIRGFELSGDTDWDDVAHEVLDRPRCATVRRATRETDISVSVDLDRATEPEISTGIGFFDHMLEQLGKHGGFELRVSCNGDLEVDEHHTVEDVALAIGQALREALGDKRGIGRYGFVLPMDEAQAQVAIDLSGRAYAVFEGEFGRESVGGLPTELVAHFFQSLSDALGAALHVSVRGDNAHHMIEACFKAVARTLRQAFARRGTDLPSTKGTL